jgi:hypothetical protein
LAAAAARSAEVIGEEDGILSIEAVGIGRWWSADSRGWLTVTVKVGAGERRTELDGAERVEDTSSELRDDDWTGSAEELVPSTVEVAWLEGDDEADGSSRDELASKEEAIDAIELEMDVSPGDPMAALITRAEKLAGARDGTEVEKTFEVAGKSEELDDWEMCSPVEVGSLDGMMDVDMALGATLSWLDSTDIGPSSPTPISATSSPTEIIQNLWLGSSTKTKHICTIVPTDLESAQHRWDVRLARGGFLEYRQGSRSFWKILLRHDGSGQRYRR